MVDAESHDILLLLILSLGISKYYCTLNINNFFFKIMYGIFQMLYTITIVGITVVIRNYNYNRICYFLVICTNDILFITQILP